MNVIIILIGLLCFTVQCGTGLEVYCVGREAVLRFNFPRRDIDVTLQIGNRYPFYSSHGGNSQLLESGLSKDQIKRFQVKQNETDNDYNIILIISNVSREDEGTYISHVYVDGEMVTDLTKRIALVVEYPPGNPHCRYVSPSYIDVIRDKWDTIECTAAIGTMHGYIVCFQNNEILPIHGNLVKNSTTLSQRIWVKRDHFFSCCSSDYRNIVDASSCKAFTSPASGEEKSVTNPQLPFVSSTTSNYIFSAENISTTGILFDNVQATPSNQTSVIEVLLLTTVLLVSVMIIFLVFKVWNMGSEITLSAQNMADIMLRIVTISRDIENIKENMTSGLRANEVQRNVRRCSFDSYTYGEYIFSLPDSNVDLEKLSNEVQRNVKRCSFGSNTSGEGTFSLPDSNVDLTKSSLIYGEASFSSLTSI